MGSGFRGPANSGTGATDWQKCMIEPSQDGNSDKSRRVGCSGLGSSCLIFIALAAVGFVLLLFSTAGPFRSVSGEGVTADEANRMLWIRPTPASASDVWFTSAYKATKVDCRLDEDDFLDWCRERGWHPIPIAKGHEKGVYLDRVRDAVLVGKGLYFSDRRGDVECSGIYDANEQRVYLI